MRASGSLFDSYRIDRPSILAFKLQQLFWGHSFWHNGGFAVYRRHGLAATSRLARVTFLWGTGSEIDARLFSVASADLLTSHSNSK